MMIEFNSVFKCILCLCSWCTYTSILFVPNITFAWRISRNFEAERDHLISGRKVEALDQTNEVKWQVPGACVAENNSAPLTSMTCVGQGFYPITAEYPNSNETQYIPVRETPLCYSWYVTTANISHHDMRISDHEKWMVQVWIVDRQHASPQESLYHTAQQPSQSSRALTMNMYQKGQSPRVMQSRIIRDQHLHIISTDYNSQLGYWNIKVSIHFLHEIFLVVKGKPEVAVNGCIVRNTFAVLSRPKFIHLPPSSTNSLASNDGTADDSVRLTGPSGVIQQLVQDPCTQTVLLIIQSDSVILTQDGFHSISELSIPRRLMIENMITSAIVESAVFTPSCLLLLIEKYVYALDKDMGIIKRASGLSSEGVDYISGRHHCIPATVSKIDSSDAIAWRRDSTSFYIFGGESTQYTFRQVQIKSNLYEPLGFDNNTSDVDIYDVAFDCPSGLVGFVANISSQDSSSAVVILTYNTVTDEWTNMPYWIQDNYNGRYSMSFLNGAKSSFLFWNDHQLHYSYNNGLDVGALMVDGGNTSVLGTADDNIKQVIVSIYGDIVLLMNPSNSMYYGRVGLHTVIEIPRSDPSNIQQMIYFDSLGRLNSVKNDSTSSSSVQLSKQFYPLALQVAGAGYPETCKYRHFDHNSSSDVYYLDLGDILSLSSTLTYPLHYFNTINVLTSSSNLIKQETVDRYEYYQGWQTLNKTVIVESNAQLYGSVNYEEQKSESVADLVIEMKPETTEMSCTLPIAMIAHVSLGCPPGRHIRVHKPDKCIMPSQYTIPRSAIQYIDGSHEETHKIVNYTVDMGCPISMRYKDTFLPTIDLYDEDIFVEEVTANFIIWEVNGRSDYSFTATMQQVGCQSVAQSWDRMQQITNGAGATHEDIWGPHNYQHCFFENATAIGEDLSQPYEIMNNTGLNLIEWNTWRNGSVYQFKVQVLDPQYSFCHLQASFGVHLTGLKPSHVPTTTIMQFSIAAFAGLTFSVGFVSYIFFRRIHIEEHELQYSPSADDDEDNNGKED